MKNYQVYKLHLVLLILICCQFSFAQIKLASVTFEGNKITKDMAMLRELPIQIGDAIDTLSLKKTLDQCQYNVYNMSLFNLVVLKDSIAGEELHLKFTVKERWYIIPTPYFFLEERTFKDFVTNPSGKRLTYGLGLSWNNVSGRRDDIFAGFTLGYSRRFFMYFDKPFIIPKKRLDASFYAGVQMNHELNYGTSNGILQRDFLHPDFFQKIYKGSVSVTKRLTNIQKINTELRYQHRIFADTIYDVAPNYLTNGRSIEHYPSISVSYSDDHRDIFAFPLNGYSYQFELEQNGLGLFSTANFLKAEAHYSHHFQVKKRWNFSWNANIQHLIGSKVPFYDKYFIGYSTFLRGYEAFLIDGTTIGSLKTDIKFAIVPRRIIGSDKPNKGIGKKFKTFPFGLYLVLFNDLGIVDDHTQSNLDKFLKNKMLYSTGVGIQMPFIYDSMIRLEYSRNHLGKFNWFIDVKHPFQY